LTRYVLQRDYSKTVSTSNHRKMPSTTAHASARVCSLLTSRGCWTR
jgi:hypothetical protein